MGQTLWHRAFPHRQRVQLVDPMKPMRRFVRSQGKGILDHKVVISEGHRWGLAPLKNTAAKILKSSARIFTTFVARLVEARGDLVSGD